MGTVQVATVRTSTSRSLATRGSLRLLLGIGLIVTLISPPLEVLEEASLSYHIIIEHLAYVLSGFLISWGAEGLVLTSILSFRNTSVAHWISTIYSKLLHYNHRYNAGGSIGLVTASAMIIFWHIPTNFDAAIINEATHLEMHISLSVAGAAVFLSLKIVSRLIGVVLLIASGKAMAVLGFFLAASEFQVFSTYPFSQQGEAGIIMVAMMLLMDLLLVPYLVRLLLKRPWIGVERIP